MNYDDTVERLAKAMASQINNVEEYSEVMTALDEARETNSYAMAMKDFIQANTDPSIVMEHSANEVSKKERKGSPVKLIIDKIFKRGDK